MFETLRGAKKTKNARLQTGRVLLWLSLDILLLYFCIKSVKKASSVGDVRWKLSVLIYSTGLLPLLLDASTRTTRGPSVSRPVSSGK